MKLNLEAKTKEQQRIKAYLEENASDILAGKINNGVLIKKDGKILLNRKTLDGFMSFATEEARKQAEKGARYAMVEDAVVFGWAVHYFEEDSIEGTLYNDDGSEYKEPSKATKSKPVSAPSKPKQAQISLFDEPEKTDIESPQEEKPQSKQDTVSPLYKTYLQLAQRYPGAVVAYRVGDFYEIFGETARRIGETLSLTITSRDCGLPERVPMIGFPYHAAELYFGKILQGGNKLVVAELPDNVREVKPDDIDDEDIEELSEEEMQAFDGDIEEPVETCDDIAAKICALLEHKIIVR
ncbi:MAG TPA: hypothetical protein IAA90_05555 [Candidatus Ornithoclostridium excrementipullorum]|nr:hypothetical protein [Candidatus Ornithoclostridium excrementipullorum]